MEPDRVLGRGWQRSRDRAVTTVGDETGLHVLVADRWTAYQWRTVATLAEPATPSDQWIGQLCVSGSGRRAVVVYAPRSFTNRPVLMERGAFAAVVDLDTGVVTKLDQRVSLGYFNPACGAGDTAVLSRLEQSAEAGVPAQTWIGTVDTTSAVIDTKVRVAGQVTSAVPVAGRILAAAAATLVEVDNQGRVTVVAPTNGQPFRLMPDGPRGLAFQVARAGEVDLVRLAGREVSTVATVPLGTVKLRPGAGGRVYAVGGRATDRVPAGLPPTWRAVDALPDSEVSTHGRIVVERAVTGREAAGRIAAVPPGEGHAQPVRIEGRLVNADGAGAEVSFGVYPAGGAAGQVPTPAPGGAPAAPDGAGPQQDHSTVPWDPDRACAVPRNDPEIQVYQPSPRQVEWAADLAVRGQLTFQRPANWLNNGLPAYSPQGIFPSKPLSGGGYVPVQVLLGVLAQESNLWQASWHVVDALAGNPLTSSGFYGIPWDNQDPTLINWSDVDCGYGAAQVTTGMHSDDTDQVVNGVTMTYTRQKAVVLDYATNVAAGLRILQDKWNQTRNAGLIANNGDPQYLENWWFAVWAYNTGFYPDPGNGEPWGVGWSNNPASPLYPEDRAMFLTTPLDVPGEGIHDEIGYDNAKHPNHWSYPERVIGFAYTSLRRYDFASQSWTETYLTPPLEPQFTPLAQPNRLTFCVPTINQCDPEQTRPPGDYPGYPDTHCLRDDLRCWWNQPITWLPGDWNGCQYCGTERRRFTTVEPRPFADSIYDSQCSTAGLPAAARIIDDIDSAAPLGPQGCSRNWASGGTFDLKFESHTNTAGSTVYPGKVDFHQIGGGFGGHFWFAHSHSDTNSPMKVVGTWTPTTRFNGWVRVFVHIPDHGAHTQQARYEIHTGSGTEARYLPTRRRQHAWVPLGTYEFSNSGAQRVELSNTTEDGRAVEDLAWDAVAFLPLPSKPDHFVVAMGDSYISGEGAGNYYGETDTNYGDHGWNACRRSRNAWPRKVVLPGTSSSVGQATDAHDPQIDFQSVACSGATTAGATTTTPWYWQNPPSSLTSFHEAADGRFGEVSQLESGALSSNTTLVLLSIGGNDAGFADVMTDCAETNCASSQREAAIQQDIDNVQPAIAALIGEIHSRAPNAAIVLVGYPRLFNEEMYTGSERTNCAPHHRYTWDEAQMLNSLADYMRDAQAATVAALAPSLDAHFVDMVTGFGNHGACPPVLGPEEIHQVVVGPTSDGDYHLVEGDGYARCVGWIEVGFQRCISRESFHPKATGNSRYGTVVTGFLASGP